MIRRKTIIKQRKSKRQEIKIKMRLLKNCRHEIFQTLK